MSDKGIIEGLWDSLSLWAAVQDSKDARGKPDPYKAAGIAWALNGDLSTADILELGGYLIAEGAFDKSSTEDSAYDLSYQPSLPPEQERRSMDWNAISDAEKQRRIDKANLTKSRHRYWTARWRYQELLENLPPIETAEKVWKKVCEDRAKLPYRDPEYQQKFAAWLRKNHDIRMDAEGKMHFIKRK